MLQRFVRDSINGEYTQEFNEVLLKHKILYGQFWASSQLILQQRLGRGPKNNLKRVSLRPATAMFSKYIEGQTKCKLTPNASRWKILMTLSPAGHDGILIGMSW